MPVFMGTLTPDQNFAISFVFQLFLIDSLRTNNEPNVIDSLKFWQEYLGSKSLSSLTVLQILAGDPRNNLV